MAASRHGEVPELAAEALRTGGRRAARSGDRHLGTCGRCPGRREGSELSHGREAALLGLGARALAP
eukprot:1790553-Alexandrium_andersonii.AAC.1